MKNFNDKKGKWRPTISFVKERLIAVYGALKDLINEKLEGTSTDDMINDVLK